MAGLRPGYPSSEKESGEMGWTSSWLVAHNESLMSIIDASPRPRAAAIASDRASHLGRAAHLSGAPLCRGLEETNMRFTQRTRGIVKTMAVVLSLALPLMLAISSADARVGGGGGLGSRGTRT